MRSFSSLFASLCLASLITCTIAAPMQKSTPGKASTSVPKKTPEDVGCVKSTGTDPETYFAAAAQKKGALKGGHNGNVIKHPDNLNHVDINEHKVIKTFPVDGFNEVKLVREVSGLRRVNQFISCEFTEHGTPTTHRKYYITMKKIKGVSLARAAVNNKAGPFYEAWYGEDKNKIAANQEIITKAIRKKAKMYAEEKQAAFMDFNLNNVRIDGTLSDTGIIIDFVDWEKWKLTKDEAAVTGYLTNTVDKYAGAAFVRGAPNAAELSESSGSSGHNTPKNGSKPPSRGTTPPIAGGSPKQPAAG